MNKRLINLCAALLLSLSFAQSQTYMTNPFSGSYFQPKANVNVGVISNFKDMLVDIGVGFDDLGYDFSITINGAFRPYFKTVTFQTSDHYYMQVNERILQFSLDLEKRFYFVAYGGETQYGKVGIYGLLKTGYYYGIHKGFPGMQNSAFALNPGAGLSWQINGSARISLGYLYFKQKAYTDVLPHMVTLKAAILLGKDKDK